MSAHHPIAFCPWHGFFPATAIAMSNSTVDVSGCVTGCPQCGSTSEILPGRYDSVGDKLNVLLDPSISPEVLRQLKELAKRLQRNEITPDEAKAEAHKVSPKAASLFDVHNWSDQAKATLYAAIIGAVSVVAAAKVAYGPETNIVVQPVVERTIERYRSSTAISRIPTPTPQPTPPPKKHR